MFSKNKIKENAETALDNAAEMTNKAKKSGKDWLEYIMDHPLQSLLFGSVIGLALRGLFKK